jgi:hypothetical protein
MPVAGRPIDPNNFSSPSRRPPMVVHREQGLKPGLGAGPEEVHEVTSERIHGPPKQRRRHRSRSVHDQLEPVIFPTDQVRTLEQHADHSWHEEAGRQFVAHQERSGGVRIELRRYQAREPPGDPHEDHVDARYMEHR